jgi:mono/diheme cytochrome c family protein
LGQQTPTRGRLAAPSPGSGKFTDTVSAEGIGATLVIDPNQPGINSFEVYLTGAVDVVESVRLDFTSPKGEDSRLILDASNPPTFYVGKGPYLAESGKWKVGVDIRRSKGSDLLLPFVTNVQAPGVQTTESRSGGAFGSPITVTPVTAGLLALSLLLAVGLIFGSYWPREQVGGVAATVAGRVSRRVARSRIRPAWSLAGLLIAGTGLGLLLGGHLHTKVTNQEAKAGNPVESTPASIERGRILFSQNCTMCHGESGRGDGPLAKSLPIPPANLYLHVPYHPDQFFFGIITNGLSGIMPSFANSISETDRWNILNYLRSQFSQDEPATQ